MMRPIVAVAFSVLVMASTSTQAADKQQKLVERLKRQIAFASSASIPDELSPIIQPYMNCGFAMSGTKAVTANGVINPPPPPDGNCIAIRATAKQQADTKLISMGVTSEADRNAVVENSLLVAELNSKGNAEYMRRYIK